MTETPNMDRAQAAWGDDIPAYVVTLAEECDTTNQTRAAHKIGKSNSMISQVLANACMR